MLSLISPSSLLAWCLFCHKQSDSLTYTLNVKILKVKGSQNFSLFVFLGPSCRLSLLQINLLDYIHLVINRSKTILEFNVYV